MRRAYDTTPMVSGLPYRAASTPPARPPPAAEFLYTPPVRELSTLIRGTWLPWVFLGLGMTAGLVGYLPTGLAWSVVLGAAGWVVWRYRQVEERMVVKVEGGELSVSRRREARPILMLPLDHLLNVELDTRSVHSVSRNTRLGSANVGTQVGPAVDVARIVLVPAAPAARTYLSENDSAHMEAIEAIGKLRVFLRSHGWVPEDERTSG